MDNEGTYLANGGGCTEVLLADEAHNSSKCCRGYTLVQQMDKVSG